jgi:hypothetical protein
LASFPLSISRIYGVLDALEFGVVDAITISSETGLCQAQPEIFQAGFAPWAFRFWESCSWATALDAIIERRQTEPDCFPS